MFQPVHGSEQMFRSSCFVESHLGVSDHLQRLEDQTVSHSHATKWTAIGGLRIGYPFEHLVLFILAHVEDLVLGTSWYSRDSLGLYVQDLLDSN